MISLLLSAFLVMAAVYGYSQLSSSRLVGHGVIALSLVGVVFVTRPSMTTEIANAVGVGRGADLLLYVWIVLTMLLFANMLLQIRAMHDKVTVLAREAAYLNAVISERRDGAAAPR